MMYVKRSNGTKAISKAKRNAIRKLMAEKPRGVQ